MQGRKHEAGRKNFLVDKKLVTKQDVLKEELSGEKEVINGFPQGWS